MITQIRKRDGSVVLFNKNKIADAIFKAAKSVGGNDREKADILTDMVLHLLKTRGFNDGNYPTVEDVQDAVEKTLIECGHAKTAKAYIIYREQHKRLREFHSFVNSNEIMDGYLSQIDWRVKENSNMSYSLQGLNNHIASIVSSNYWLNKIYPPEIREAHVSGDFHIHDLQILGSYCCGWDLLDLLMKGFGGVSGKIESKPPKHLGTALGQMVNFFYTLQGECYSDDTEVLTDNGWKLFKDIDKRNDKVFTLNMRTKEIELQKPLRYYEHDAKEMVHFFNNKVDLLVTPDHNMLVAKYRPDRKRKEYDLTLVKAKDYNPDDHLMLNGESELSDFKVSKDSIENVDYNGKVYCVEVPNHTLYVRRKGKAAWCGNCAGAQAFSNFSTYIAPFIRYDKLGYEDVKQAMQEFIFNMNVPTRVGFQSPFSNVTMDLTVPDMLKRNPVIIGGKPMPETYGEFQKEVDMLNKAFIEVMGEGDSKGRTFGFPIPTYNITKDIDWDSPVLNDLFEVTAKLGIPYFSNFINSDMKPDDVRSMCCRLRLQNNELRRRGGGIFAANPLTGSLGVVTLNLPRIAYQTKDEAKFIARVLELMALAKESLDIKRKVVENFTEKGLYPYSRKYLQGVKDMKGKYWANHFNTIGLIGMNEAVMNLFGTNIASKEGGKFALKVMDVMRDELKRYQDQSDDNYNLEATPGEGCTYRMAKLDKAKYPDIITAGSSLVPYYTNSTHLPVGYTDDIFEALDLQDELQCKYTGGTVLHGFVGERISDAETCKKLVRKIASNYRLPYFTITPTFSVCPTHGYIKGEHRFCPYEVEEEVIRK